MYPKRMWYQNHSVVPDYGYARSHLSGGSADRLATWTGREEDRRAERLCDRPTGEWYEELLAEDDENRRDLARIDRLLARNGIDLAQRPVWEKALKALRINAELFAASKKAYFAVRLHKNVPEAMPREAASRAIDGFEAVVRRLEPLPAHARVRKYDEGRNLAAVRSLRRALSAAD
jgi:hypothetical protein